MEGLEGCWLDECKGWVFVMDGRGLLSPTLLWRRVEVMGGVVTAGD